MTISNFERFNALYTAKFLGPLFRFEKYAIEDLPDYAIYIDSYLFDSWSELLIIQKETVDYKNKIIKEVLIY